MNKFRIAYYAINIGINAMCLYGVFIQPNNVKYKIIKPNNKK